ncbi:hypothetical protein [Romboutsia sp.]|uniref:hypothetical protein n=1 Tax=Romboutsia sp. TaxID=1965302 RepID=UPI002C82E25E|nr:hypothetical protein [Romboutsia sp.]HSQ89453.1 hypothetical protein [Romboutsia sp.]
MNISNKIMQVIIKLVMGILNILIIMPFTLSLIPAIISLYLLDIALLLMPIALIVNLIMPQLPISFGTEVLWLKILLSLTAVTIGCYFSKTLMKYSTKYFKWLWVYMKKSITFTLVDKHMLLKINNYQ